MSPQEKLTRLLTGVKPATHLPPGPAGDERLTPNAFAAWLQRKQLVLREKLKNLR